MERVLTTETDSGPARVAVRAPDAGAPRYLLVMTHGAGADVDTPDLAALGAQALAEGAVVAAVTQPYRVAGKPLPPAAGRQDPAWIRTVAAVRAEWPRAPLVVAGRSNGARVACRTAADVRARAVIALAFPLHPPGKPERSRAAELRGAGVAAVAVNGDRDAFGVPDGGAGVTVVVRPGETHALDRDPGGAAAAALEWLHRQELQGGA